MKLHYRLKHLIKEAWVDQSNCSQLSLDLTSDSNHSIEQRDSTGSLETHDVVQDGSHDNGSHDANQPTINSMASPSKRSCFITQVNVV